MGGRGASSGIGSNKVVGVAITTKDGNTTNYYFVKSGNQNYYQRNADGQLQPTPLNMSMSEFKKRAESNGAKTKNITLSEKTKAEIARKADRDATSKQLNDLWFRAAPKKKKGWKGH